ncbi:DMT family transporter [Filomicrobium sp.]|uniref:DMT family transporter n=1 Tax=Filomicrobium sp. TaxID=2024831 RepID=UPI0025866E42|nr:DMT family transporter [Filomicrobium sp.]MCV0368235.1 DMT family transporter [Filomicrobium sp.]
MAFSDDARRQQDLARPQHGRFSTSDGDWVDPDDTPRDWKKVILVIGLGALSWVATYVGMLELIESNLGSLPIGHRIIIGFSVAMLMTMIIWLLDQIFSPINTSTKIVYIAGYLFLSLISIGFGFGFYWKVLESRQESTRSAEAAVAQVQNSLHAGSTRLEQLNATLVQLTELSSAKAIEEREKGTTCPNSRPGDGPRRKLRDDDAQRFLFASEFVKGRIATVKAELSSLDGDLAKVVKGDPSTIDAETGTRNDFLNGLNRRLDMTVTGFNAFRGDPQLRQIRADLDDRAGKTIFPTSSGGTFTCPDPQLQTALRGVVRAIDQLPQLTKPRIAAVEGSEATIEAFRRLTATLQGALVLDLPPSAEELRELQKKAVQSVSEASTNGQAPPGARISAGLSPRDYIPLAIAAFVDLCLLLVSMGRPMNRLNNLVPIMREAERGPMIKILSRFNEIHRDPEIRQNFEVFRHVVFDMYGAYYVAVPLDAPYKPHERNGANGFGFGASDAQDLQHEAHLLANLFSGFEQQRIFSRVYNPFLSTRAIQRKLWRQGSKFAGCHAFRVYRFRDGAWSDMILQAVMGAARRVEEEKRRRQRLEDEAAVQRGPELAMGTSEQKAENGRTREPQDRKDRWPHLDIPAPDLRDSGAERAKAYAISGRRKTRKANGHFNGHRIPVASAELNGSATEYANGSGLAANGNGHAAKIANGAARSGARINADAEREATLRSAFGRYAATAAFELNNNDAFYADLENTLDEQPETHSNKQDVRVETETIRTTADDEAMEKRNAADVLPFKPPASASNDTIKQAATSLVEKVREVMPSEARETTVTMTRETATFSIPVTEARLPIMSAERVPHDSVETEISEETVVSLVPPPLPSSAQQIVTDVEVVEDANTETQDDDEARLVTLVSRLRPAPGGEVL